MHARRIGQLAIVVALTAGLAACDIQPAPVGRGDPPPGNAGGAQLVVPVPGQLDVHPVAIDRFIAEVADHHVAITAFFTSGVEPCFVLDSVVVQRGPGSVAITLVEGRGPGNVACRLMAVTKKTAVDLGELASGRYLITDSGHAPTVEVDVD